VVPGQGTLSRLDAVLPAVVMLGRRGGGHTRCNGSRLGSDRYGTTIAEEAWPCSLDRCAPPGAQVTPGAGVAGAPAGRRAERSGSPACRDGCVRPASGVRW
jgi:hypothetical protein